MKLKDLLLTKFLNKYRAVGSQKEGLEKFIDTELSKMFN